MAFFKKIKKFTNLLKRLFSRPKRRRKSPARKSKKKIIRKPAIRRIPKIKKISARKSENSSLPIGQITHFFPRIQVCVLKVSGHGIKVGDQILIVGKDRRFPQKVRSLQIESVDVKSAKRGDLVGLKLDKPAAVGDKVFFARD